ncbi:hypothetical protein [Sulfitobacter sp. AS59]|uniref:hypothetical protein n=1 Tax=Sulfitobacter sp. AS59 TaxID=3135784 RepID=UPI0031822F2A
MKYLKTAVDNGDASILTYKQRENLMPGFLAHISQTGRSLGKAYATLPVDIPPHELVLFRDSLMSTPGKATNTFKMLKAMFKWALDRKYTQTNPAAAIKVNYVSKGGAKPWTLDDLEKFREAHPKGTMAHLTLTLFMFTACRISEAYKLGRPNEVKKGGVSWLEWQPSKKTRSLSRCRSCRHWHKRSRRRQLLATHICSIGQASHLEALRHSATACRPGAVMRG